MYCWNLARESLSDMYSELARLLTNGGFRLPDLRKLDDTTTFGTCSLEENLRKFDLTGCLEELDQVFVCC